MTIAGYESVRIITEFQGAPQTLLLACDENFSMVLSRATALNCVNVRPLLFPFDKVSRHIVHAMVARDSLY